MFGPSSATGAAAALLAVVVLAAAGGAVLGQQTARLDVLCEWTSQAQGGAWPNHRNVLASVVVADTPHNSTGGAVEVIVNSYNFNDGGARACWGSVASYYGILRIIDGRTCALHESVGSSNRNHHIIASSTPAVADVDGDGIVEIFTLRAVTGIIAWKYDTGAGAYAPWWVSSSGSSFSSTCRWDSLALHDLDDDGIPEVINAGEVHNALTGARLNPGQRVFGSVKFSTVANVDGDPGIELVDQNVYEWDTTTNRWVTEYPAVLPRASGWSGYALADFGTPIPGGGFNATSLDGIAEIVGTSSGRIGVYTLGGDVVFETSAGTGGGPPIVGDFDLDGFPEVAQASRAAQTVYDLECAAGASFGCDSAFVRWRQPSQDFSSSITGSSLFQFEAGEAPASVYADECFSRVYEGQTGEVLFSSFRTSCTWSENPVIANVDGRPGTEIVIGSNDNCNVGCATIDPIHKGIRCTTSADCPQNGSPVCTNGFCRCTSNLDCDSDTRCTTDISGTGGGSTCRAYHPPGVGVTGARVFTDANGQWQDAGPLWNQHTFTVTNILANQTVPRSSEWEASFALGLGAQFNNYRANAVLCDRFSCLNGNCVGANRCVCDPGWSGPSCAEAFCFTNMTPPGCLNFGFCSGPDICDCRVSGLPGPRCVAPVTTGTTGFIPTALPGTSTGSCVSNFGCINDMCGVFDDGCGGQEYCGDCTVGGPGTGSPTPYPAQYECDAFTKTCKCVPDTCFFPKSRSCGNYTDGCGGSISCGSCIGGEVCDANGACQLAACTHLNVTCESVGLECGQWIPDPSCYPVFCGSCKGLSTCSNNTCGCVPSDSCAQAGRFCGTYFNGCDYEQCGPGCPAGDTCLLDGTCASGYVPTTGTTATTGGASSTANGGTGTGSGSNPPSTTAALPTANPTSVNPTGGATANASSTTGEEIISAASPPASVSSVLLVLIASLLALLSLA